MSCYAAVGSLALPHISHATLLLRFSCTSTHTSFYAIVVSLALPHMCHATLEKSAPHLAATSRMIKKMELMMMMMMVMVMVMLMTIMMMVKKMMLLLMLLLLLMMMFVTMLLIKLKFRFWTFSIPPVKWLKSDDSRGPLRCPAPCFTLVVIHDTLLLLCLITVWLSLSSLW